MKYRQLGKTQMRVSVIGVGTWQFDGEWGKNFTVGEVGEILRKAQELGINLIDTAECYGDHLSEALIGEALEGQREDWIIATKFGHHFEGHLQRTEPRTPADVQKQLEDSLRALRTDYIDLYQYHSWGDQDFENDKVATVLVKARQAGKVRHIGNSVGRNDNLRQVDLSGKYGVESVQIIYNRIDQTPEKEVLGSCLRQNLGVMARVPLASGLLSGKYHLGAKFENTADVRQSWSKEQLEKKLQLVEEVRKEVPAGMDMAQWALAWCLRHPAVSCVIPGCKSVAQVESNAKAAKLAT